MTELQFIKKIQKALSDNKNGDKASIMNALELVEEFKKPVIKGYLKTKKKGNEYAYNDTKVKR